MISGGGILDLQTGATTPIEGVTIFRDVRQYSSLLIANGDGDTDCLDPCTIDTGEELCRGFYVRFARDNLVTRAHDVIGAEYVPAQNNDDLYIPSPDGAYLAVAVGSGLIGSDGPTGITLKRLPSPP